MSLSEQKQWCVGDLVWVRRQSATDTLRFQQVHEEAGVVIQMGCEYHPERENGNEYTTKSDGVMVKLQVSNTRGIYPPLWLRPLEEKNTRQQKQRPKSSVTAMTPAVATSRRRTAVTPSPTPTNVTTTKSSETSQEDEKKKTTKPPKQNNKGTAKNPTRLKRTRANDSDDDDEEVNSDNEDTKPVPKKSRSSSTKGKVAAKPSKAAKKVVVQDASAVKAKAGPTKKTAGAEVKVKAAAPKVQLIVASDTSDAEASSNNNEAEEEDSDNEDRPYRVEYAPSGRATCRSCDERIDKGTLRTCHTPLFRGKPGYVNYRHLYCATFDDSIEQMSDIGGWRKLKKMDQKALADRLIEAKIVTEKENQELQPDELVQVAFQGETRKAPEGLVAGLLPFQVEGASWMYHQEVNIPELRGGILADEMGMVRRCH
jgi:hypothetical protein